MGGEAGAGVGVLLGFPLNIPLCHTGPQFITARREGRGGEGGTGEGVESRQRGRGQAVCEEVEV